MLAILLLFSVAFSETTVRRVVFTLNNDKTIEIEIDTALAPTAAARFLALSTTPSLFKNTPLFQLGAPSPNCTHPITMPSAASPVVHFGIPFTAGQTAVRCHISNSHLSQFNWDPFKFDGPGLHGGMQQGSLSFWGLASPDGPNHLPPPLDAIACGPPKTGHPACMGKQVFISLSSSAAVNKALDDAGFIPVGRLYDEDSLDTLVNILATIPAVPCLPALWENGTDLAGSPFINQVKVLPPPSDPEPTRTDDAPSDEGWHVSTYVIGTIVVVVPLAAAAVFWWARRRRAQLRKRGLAMWGESELVNFDGDDDDDLDELRLAGPKGTSRLD